MKKLLISMLSVLLLAACGSDDGGGNGGSFIPPSQNERNQTAYADNENTGGGGFTFTANAAWTATVTEVQPEAAVSPQALKVAKSSTAETGNNVVWLRLYVGDRESYSGPAGQTTLRIELDQNYTGERREATITIRSGNNTFTVTVVQEANKQDGSANVDPNPVTAVNVDKETLSLEVGGTTTLTATVTPADATIKSVKWSSSNPSVAEVHPVTGLVTAVGGGTSVVYATSSSNSGAADSCLVTVAGGGSTPTGVRFVTAITESAQFTSDYYSNEDNGMTYNPFNYEFKYDEENRLKEYIVSYKSGSQYDVLTLDYSIMDEIRLIRGSEDSWTYALNAQGYVSRGVYSDLYGDKESIVPQYDEDGYMTGAAYSNIWDENETYDMTWADGNMVRWTSQATDSEHSEEDEYREGVSEFSQYANNTRTSIDLNAFFFGLLDNDNLFEYSNDNPENILAMAWRFGKPSKNYMTARHLNLDEESGIWIDEIYTESTLPEAGEVIYTSHDRSWYGNGEWTMDGDGFPVAFTRKVRVAKTERVYNGIKTQVYPVDEYEAQEWLHLYGEGPYYRIGTEFPVTEAYDTYTWTITYKQ